MVSLVPRLRPGRTYLYPIGIAPVFYLRSDFAHPASLQGSDSIMILILQDPRRVVSEDSLASASATRCRFLSHGEPFLLIVRSR